jgi:hypothetical protein
MAKASFRMHRGGSGTGMRWMAKSWNVSLEERHKQRREAKMTTAPDSITEMLARMWMACDPNRGGIDPDELLPMAIETASTAGGPVDSRPNPLGGMPHWHWFIPRAEATRKFLDKHGYALVKET